jgi:3-oxoacyl-[acyl-carrier protein] reductase
MRPERVVIVTGGTRGIGRAIVETLAADGSQVAFTWCSDEAAARAVEAAAAGLARAFPLDVRDRSRPSALVSEVEAAMGPIGALVNNAGIRREGILALTSDAEWEEVIDVNLGGVFRCCRAVLPGMVSRRSGSIVNVASLSAIHGRPGQAVYAASKAAILGLTRSLSKEVGRKGVRVNAVLPGYVATDLTKPVPADVVSTLRSLESLRSGTSPRDVADAVAFLVSDRARAITGQALVVDAGASA